MFVGFGEGREEGWLGRGKVWMRGGWEERWLRREMVEKRDG